MNVKSLTINEDREHYDALPPAAKLSDKRVYFQYDPEILIRSIEDSIPFDVCPIPNTLDREGYHDDRHMDYWASGFMDYSSIVTACKRHGLELGKDSNVYEMGCATGRVLRHFSAQSDLGGIWGSDINRLHIDWMLKHLGPDIRVFQNTIIPNLSIDSAVIDLFYAISVFTHIEECETAWLMEINRILKRGGICYISIHSERTWQEIRSTYLYKSLMGLPVLYKNTLITDDFFNQAIPEDRVVLRYNTGADIYNTNVFHTDKYIHNVWGRYFDVLEIIPKGHAYHDVVVLRKK